MKTYGKFIILFALLAAACGQLQETSPTEALKQYVEAIKSKNLDKIKETASKKTIQLMEETAKEEGMTLEEAIQKNEPVIPPILQNPETRNEKINGSKATVEVRNKYTDSWIEMDFVKEDGRWKVAAGDMFYDTIENFNEKFETVDKELERLDKEVNKKK
ncbi:MAG TPA: hypothetical protein VF721_12735 [Pyrinomonadaceae bacterium]|jgi:hypothetical protein